MEYFLIFSIASCTCLVGYLSIHIHLLALIACIGFKIGQPLHKTSLNAIRLWFNCSLISMDKANVLHRVIIANHCSGREEQKVGCVLKGTSEFIFV